MSDSDSPKHKKPLVAYTDDGLYLSGRVLAAAIVAVLGGGGLGVFSAFGSAPEPAEIAAAAVRAHEDNTRAHVVPDIDKGVVKVVESQQAALKRIDDRADRVEGKVDRVGVILVEFVANDTAKTAIKKNPKLSQTTIDRIKETVKDNLQAEKPRQATAGIEGLVE